MCGDAMTIIAVTKLSKMIPVLALAPTSVGSLQQAWLVSRSRLRRRGLTSRQEAPHRPLPLYS